MGWGRISSGICGANLSIAIYRDAGGIGSLGRSDRHPAFAGYELSVAGVIGGAAGDDDQGQEKCCQDD